MADGKNPLRWDCSKSGCFNHKKRPKIEEFSCLFPGKIAMSDVDGVVEINGRFFFLEWKPAANPLARGQAILYERLTAVADDMFVVYVVAGDAESMEVKALKVFRGGQEGCWREETKEALFASIQKWVRFASAGPRPKVQLNIVPRKV